MLIPLPVRFDINEWFVLIAMTAVIVLSAWLRRVIPFSISVAVYLFTACVGTWTDYVIGLYFQTYLALDTMKHELFDVLCLDVAYPFVWVFSDVGFLCTYSWRPL